MFQRLFARRQRLSPVGPARPVAIVVLEAFVFRGVFFLRFFTEQVSGADPVPLLQRADGSLVRPDMLPDAANAHAERFATCLRLVLPPGETEATCKDYKLLLQYPDCHWIASPFPQRETTDPYYLSDKLFWDEYAKLAAPTVVEIGSRARSGITRRSLFPNAGRYIGVDITSGPNVDLICDAHEVSRHLPHESVDVIFSVSVWEHLAMPWKASIELNRILKVGGLAHICTHQTWPPHEEPWDYFRFSNWSWDALFNSRTGFEILTRGTGVPAAVVPVWLHDANVASDLGWFHGQLATRCIARKIGPAQVEWPVPLSEISASTYGY
ncbi:methyltransferase domain-containing protein [Nibricoccus sp. IMCC34717]|uniref:methyltransferase domain-containing protein n=1 Tax=Nibricoccus sp. IMCC34717 TaxID=3034021 RepID=UPI00384A768F